MERRRLGCVINAMPPAVKTAPSDQGKNRISTIQLFCSAQIWLHLTGADLVLYDPVSVSVMM